MDDAARSLMVDRVLPHATLVTPNKHEAEVREGDLRHDGSVPRSRPSSSGWLWDSPLLLLAGSCLGCVLVCQLLVGYPLSSASEYERAAKDLLDMGRCKAVSGGTTQQQQQRGARTMLEQQLADVT